MSVLTGRRLAVYAALCAIWGSTWLAIKIGLKELPPLSFAALRMSLAFVVLTPWALAARRRGGSLTPGERRWVAWSGFLQIGVAYACVFVGEQWIDSGLTALLFATFPIFIGLFGHLLLPEERLTLRTAASALLGLGGIAVIEAPAARAALAGQTRTLLAGGALIVTSALASGYANVVNKRHLGRVPPPVNIWGQTLAGSAFLVALALAFERGAPLRWTPLSAGALAYLAVVGTALPFAGLFWLIARVPVAVIGTIPVVDTVIAICLGAAVLGEKLSGRLAVGGALILIGVILATSSVRRERRRPPPR